MCFCLYFYNVKFKVNISETVPVQIDGEAWPQVPCTMIVERLPYQSAMLEKSSKRFYQSRGAMQHEVRDLLQRVSATAIDLTQLSSRRQYTFEGGTVTSPVSGVSHTLYKKLDEDESNETEGIHVKIEEDDEPERAESPQ